MSSAKITLIGFYKMFDSLGDDLFKHLTLPDGIDKETLTDNILLRGGEFEVLLSDPEFLQLAIGTWSNKWQRTFNKWVTALNIEYNPLENYDRMESWQDDENNTSSASSHDTSSGSGDSGTVDKVSAYNSSTFENDTSTTTNTHNSNESNSTINNSSTRANTRTGRAHGNIGVTTSQQMLQSELDIATWNVYEHITDMFLSEFVIPIY